MTGWFSVHHGALSDVNGQFRYSVEEMGRILSDLEGLLKNADEATQGKALPLWQDQQTQWRLAYGDMSGRLTDNSNASHHIGEVWRNGDDQSGRIMGG
jgi:uncharacterized protein YukE